jgi:hypothetical protein
MTAETAAQCVKVLAATPSITTLDITGGAPELNDSFRMLVQMARQLDPMSTYGRCILSSRRTKGRFGELKGTKVTLCGMFRQRRKCRTAR